MPSCSSDIEHIELGSFVDGDLRAGPTDAIRIVTWNIARGQRFDEVTDFLASTNADLILLQEADRYARRTGYRNIPAELAKRLKMNYAFGIEFQELSQGSGESSAYHGQATLSPLPLFDCRIVRFRRQSNFWRPYWWVPMLPFFQRRLGGRMALVTHLMIGNKTLAAYSVHLESRNGDDLRQSQLDELLADTRGYDVGTPIVVAGDFNFDVSQNSTLSTLQELQFETTFNSDHGAPIDWILTHGPLQAMAARVDTSVRASDHYPLFLTLRLS